MGVGLTAAAAALETLALRTAGSDALGLRRIEALLASLGDPHRQLRCLHVAGTNGKGSVVATLDAVLRARGWRVGRYTSPHLVDFRERIVIDGAMIDTAFVERFVAQHLPRIEAAGASFFEATTALAFSALADANVDIAVIEVGLGGRLDATNVITPLVAGVTSIGLDHTEWLGPTTREIAAEKAGIFKSGAAAVIGELDDEIRQQLVGHATRVGATPIRVVGEEWPADRVEVSAVGTTVTLALPDGPLTATTPLVGAHQAQNLATALAMLDALPGPWRVPPREASALLPHVSLAGRFQRIGKFIFDVAHNPGGAAVLAKTLLAVRPDPPIWVLLTVLTDKDWRGMMRALAPYVAGFVLSRAPTAPSARAWDPAAAASWASSEGLTVVLEPDFDAALAEAARRGATVLVTGSFHTVGDTFGRLPNPAVSE